MNICFISSEYPGETGNGGIATYVRAVSRILIKLNHSVTVIASTSNNSISVIIDEGIKVYRVPSDNFNLPSSKIFYPFRKFCYINIFHTLVRKAWAKSAGKLFNKLHKEKPFDILEAAECGAESLYCKIDKNLKFIIRLHTPYSMNANLNNMETFLDKLYLGYLEKKETKRATLITSPSKSLANILTKKWNLKSVTTIPNPYPKDELPNLNNKTKNLILFPGRIEKRKGIETLIKALAILKEKNIKFTIQFIGSTWGKELNGKPYQEQIEDLIDFYKLNNFIDWKGKVTWEQGQELMNKASIIVIPSIWENYPYTCMEAMAMGATVVASNCGGIPEMIIHTENGFLANPEDERKLSIALKQALTVSNNSKIGSNARKFVEQNLLPKNISESIEKLYTL